MITLQTQVNEDAKVVQIFDDDFVFGEWFDEESKEYLDQRREVSSPKRKQVTAVLQPRSDLDHEFMR